MTERRTIRKYMDMHNGKEIAETLSQISRLIDQEQFAAVSEHMRNFTLQYPEWVDERLQAELQLVMKQMEYKIALKDFAYLRSLALVYKYCEMNYAKVVLRDRADRRTSEAAGAGQPVSQEDTEFLPERDTIWWCWLQGFERAPELVKSCYRSLEKLGKKVVILDETNLHEYVKLPDHVLDKYQRGIIVKAHYTDMVRLELLTEKGGTWIDATTWISGTERILPLLESEDLFMYRSGHVSEYIIFDNWFMHAAKPSRILEATKELLYAYWEKEDEAKHYFIFHLMMTLACRQFQEEYGKIPVFSNEPCHVLQYELQRPFQEKRWQQILGMSDVHKLTYKMDEGKGDGTFLGYLVSWGKDEVPF